LHLRNVNTAPGNLATDTKDLDKDLEGFKEKYSMIGS